MDLVFLWTFCHLQISQFSSKKRTEWRPKDLVSQSALLLSSGHLLYWWKYSPLLWYSHSWPMKQPRVRLSLLATYRTAYICMHWSNPRFDRIGKFNLWWGIEQLLKNLSDWKMIFHDFAKYMCFVFHVYVNALVIVDMRSCLLPQKYKTGLAFRELNWYILLHDRYCGFCAHEPTICLWRHQ